MKSNKANVSLAKYRTLKKTNDPVVFFPADNKDDIENKKIDLNPPDKKSQWRRRTI